MATFVLDTSALLAILNQEDGLDTVQGILKEAEVHQHLIYVPFMALMELEHLLLRNISPEETSSILELIRAWPIQLPESDDEWRHQAAEVKAHTPFSVADAWIAALAQLCKAELVHKDPEYEQAPDLRMLKLPYKESGEI